MDGVEEKLDRVIGQNETLALLMARLIDFEAADHERLLRLESMVAYQMEQAVQEVLAAPTLDQAKQLKMMGQPPWPRLKVATNHYELWKQGFTQRMNAHEVIDAKA